MVNQGTVLLTLPLLLQIVPGTVGHPAPSEDGTLCRNGNCGPDNTRGHDSTWGKGDSNGETCTPETVTLTAISTEQLPGPTTTVPGPTNTVTITTEGPAVTSTITEILTSTVTDASTSSQVVTDTETVTVTVTNPGTITTATTTATTTVTSCPTNGAGSGDGPDYGTCSDPTIRWADGLDGRTELNSQNPPSTLPTTPSSNSPSPNPPPIPLLVIRCVIPSAHKVKVKIGRADLLHRARATATTPPTLSNSSHLIPTLPTLFQLFPPYPSDPVFFGADTGHT
ncbi:unnamed protein product [Aspergillus oryzae var. brunneus]|uniref:Unnamed protein product n=2 Tax=Aspergillus oryzae TaxID=5062 RepID=A0AAN4YFZ7_ASPOZ|nr:unnamed protein product [Aspergillus oryzae]GMG49773.1 unnamed protein product [Aspergillus oryzae var. brunneus]